jgi:hypothetical protein
MRAALLSTISLMAAISSGALQESLREIPQHPTFRWSLRQSHELPYGINLANSKEITDLEREAVVKHVEAEVRPWTSDLEIHSEQALRKLVLRMRVKLVDLDGYGVPELVLQAFGINEGCGAVGNCPVWILQKSHDVYTDLLDTPVSAELITLGPGRTSGFLDITFAARDSASEKKLHLYRVRDGKYHMSACYDANWLSNSDPTQALRRQPAITPIACA